MKLQISLFSWVLSVLVYSLGIEKEVSQPFTWYLCKQVTPTTYGYLYRAATATLIHSAMLWSICGTSSPGARRGWPSSATFYFIFSLMLSLKNEKEQSARAVLGKQGVIPAHVAASCLPLTVNLLLEYTSRLMLASTIWQRWWDDCQRK